MKFATLLLVVLIFACAAYSQEPANTTVAQPVAHQSNPLQQTVTQPAAHQGVPVSIPTVFVPIVAEKEPTQHIATQQPLVQCNTPPVHHPTQPTIAPVAGAAK